jgi:hypothetical protein
MATLESAARATASPQAQTLVLVPSSRAPATEGSAAPSLVDSLVRLAVALALVTVSLSFAYYLLFYIPAEDARTQASVAANTAAQMAATQQAAAKRSANYKACVVAAEGIYRSEWDETCASRPQNPGSDSAGGASSLPTLNCQLPAALATSLGDELKDARYRCLQQARNGLLDQ